MTRVATIALSDLDARSRDAWFSLRDANPHLDSPFFHPSFAAAVHASGRPVAIAIERHGGRVTSLLPHHRDGRVLRPVGWPGADFQGPIKDQHVRFDPTTLLGRGVHSFTFDHLIAPNPGFERWIEALSDSPYIDVSGGLDGYLARCSRSGKENIGQARRRANRAERELGPIRFVAQSGSADDLREVIRLKREQYGATGARDYFAASEHRTLVESIFNTRDETSFRGVLSTVHAGDHLLAAHFGIRSGRVLHWWFPVYDPAYAHLAPGWILLRELIGASTMMGVERIDLGRGDDEYKRRAKTGESTVYGGSVTRSNLRRVLRQGRTVAVSVAKASPLAPQLRATVHKFRARRVDE
jgi:CelD/BcsL family acetyltransferase involved in cellulose biosynthesis